MKVTASELLRNIDYFDRYFDGKENIIKFKNGKEITFFDDYEVEFALSKYEKVKDLISVDYESETITVISYGGKETSFDFCDVFTDNNFHTTIMNFMYSDSYYTEKELAFLNATPEEKENIFPGYARVYCPDQEGYYRNGFIVYAYYEDGKVKTIRTEY